MLSELLVQLNVLLHDQRRELPQYWQCFCLVTLNRIRALLNKSVHCHVAVLRKALCDELSVKLVHTVLALEVFLEFALANLVEVFVVGDLDEVGLQVLPVEALRDLLHDLVD